MIEQTFLFLSFEQIPGTVQPVGPHGLVCKWVMADSVLDQHIMPWHTCASSVVRLAHTSYNTLSVPRPVGMQMVDGILHAVNQLQGQRCCPILMLGAGGWGQAHILAGSLATVDGNVGVPQGSLQPEQLQQAEPLSMVKEGGTPGGH